MFQAAIILSVSRWTGWTRFLGRRSTARAPDLGAASMRLGSLRQRVRVAPQGPPLGPLVLRQPLEERGVAKPGEGGSAFSFMRCQRTSSLDPGAPAVSILSKAPRSHRSQARAMCPQLCALFVLDGEPLVVSDRTGQRGAAGRVERPPVSTLGGRPDAAVERVGVVASRRRVVFLGSEQLREGEAFGAILRNSGPVHDRGESRLELVEALAMIQERLRFAAGPDRRRNDSRGTAWLPSALPRSDRPSISALTSALLGSMRRGSRRTASRRLAIASSSRPMSTSAPPRFS